MTQLRDRVHLSASGGVSTLTLSWPEKGNALDLEMTLALREAAHAVAGTTGLRALRIDGRGKAFCVGGDLQEFAAAADPAAHVMRVATAAHEALTVIRDLAVPVVTVVHGAVAGGGLGLALSGDVVLAADSSRFRLAYTAAGLSPDCGASFHLARVLGPARAADLALTNRTLSGSEAEAWGLVSRTCPAADLATTAAAVLRQLAEASGPALALTKSLLRRASAAAWSEHLAAEAAGISALAGSPDGREGVAAFLARRPAVFAGVRPESKNSTSLETESSR